MPAQQMKSVFMVSLKSTVPPNEKITEDSIAHIVMGYLTNTWEVNSLDYDLLSAALKGLPIE